MALPTYVSNGAFVAGQANISVAAPATYVVDAANPDLELLIVETANEVVSTPSGFTIAPSSPVSIGTAAAIGAVRLSVFYRWVTATLASLNIPDVGNHVSAARFIFRGVDPSNPFAGDANSTQAPTTAMSFPSINTAVNDCLVLLLAGLDRDANSTTTVSAWTNGALSSITERLDNTSAGGVGGGLALAEGGKATAGSTGTSSATSATSVNQATITLALRPVNRMTPDTMASEASMSGTLTSAGAALAGDVASEASIAAALLVGVLLSGGASAEVTSGGDLSTASVLSPSGAPVQASASGLITTQVRLEGASTGSQNVAGALSTQIRLSGIAEVVGSTPSVGLDTEIRLIGQASCGSSVSANLTAGGSQIAGSAQCGSSASGLLGSSQVVLAGSIDVGSSVAGALQTTILLAGMASVSSSAQSQLDTAVRLGGSIAIASSSLAGLTTSISLETLASVSTSLASALNTSVRLNGHLPVASEMLADLQAETVRLNVTRVVASVVRTTAFDGIAGETTRGTVRAIRGTVAGASVPANSDVAAEVRKTSIQARVQ